MVLVLAIISHIAMLVTQSPGIVRISPQETELCSVDVCANQIPHVICSPTRSAKCTAVDFPGAIREAETRRVMLHSFNQYRNSWAGGYGLDNEGYYPGASNMHEVMWSGELETYARKTCSRCLVDFSDDCRDTAEGSVGQLFYLKLYDDERPPGDIEMVRHIATQRATLAAQLSEDKHTECVHKVFNAWVLDAAYLTPAAIKNYTALSNNLTTPSVIFWKLREIGCSSASITLLNSSSGRLVICNLYPAGPINGWPIYRAGIACENCVTGFRCSADGKYPLLCDRYIPRTVPTEEASSNNALPLRGAAYMRFYLCAALRPFIYH